MIIHVLKTTKVEDRSGTKDGRGWRMRGQSDVFAQLPGEPFPVRIELGLSVGKNGESDQPPYAEGVYEVDYDASVYIGPRGSVEFRRELVLIPAKGAATKAA